MHVLIAERQRLRLVRVTALPSIERVIEFLKHELGESQAKVATHVQR
ncbi:hypothetical protein [Delftia lacustris]|nr:hypothetical protein [Delftia lacustris]